MWKVPEPSQKITAKQEPFREWNVSLEFNFDAAVKHLHVIHIHRSHHGNVRGWNAKPTPDWTWYSCVGCLGEFTATKIISKVWKELLATVSHLSSRYHFYHKINKQTQSWKWNKTLPSELNQSTGQSIISTFSKRVHFFVSSSLNICPPFSLQRLQSSHHILLVNVLFVFPSNHLNNLFLMPLLLIRPVLPPPCLFFAPPSSSSSCFFNLLP